MKAPSLPGLIPEPPRHDPVDFRCAHPGCREEGTRGFGIRAERRAWFCEAHKAEGERRMPQNVARAA